MKTLFRLWLTVITTLVTLNTGGPRLAQAAGAVTLTVNTNKDDLNYDDNLCSFREAMRRAFDNDSTAVALNDCPASTGGNTTIKFAIAGSIVISTGVGLGVLPHVRNGVTLIGPVTIDAGQLDQQLFVEHSDAIFSLVNVTIKNAKWTAISNDDGGKLQISGGKFENNSAGGAGGGAIRTGGETIIAGTAFVNNKAVKKPGETGTKDGGAIRSTWKLTIASATFTGNVADGQGGAIMAQSHSFDIVDSAFTGNVAGGLPHDLDQAGDGGQYGAGGGAISYAASGNTYPSSIKRAAFQGNVALNGSGGAVFHNGNNALTVADSSFQANHAGNPASKGTGGAIFNISTLIVKRSSFTANSVDGDGGALANDIGGQVTLRMAGFAGNNASGRGGAIINSNLTGSEAKINMLGVQVTGNIAGDKGGGIYNYDSKYDTAEVRMSVWAGNLPQNCLDKQTSDENTPDPNDDEVWPVDSKGQNFFSDSSCDADEDNDDSNPGDPGFSADPKLDPPANNGGAPGLLTQKPRADSPLLDKVAPANASTDPEDQTDIRGMPRGQNGTGFGAGLWDIGPFEREDASPEFSSLPVPGATISVGVGQVNTLFTKTAALKIYNGGAANLTLSGVANSGANPADFLLSISSPVAGLGAQLVDIACKPGAAGARGAVLTFNTNDPAKPSVSYTLSCSGVAGGAPVLDSTPAAGGLVSRDARVGDAANLIITFKNQGNANLTFASPLLIATPAGGITSNGLPVPGTLAPGGASAQVFPCNTSTPGIKTATLTFTTNEAGNPSRKINLVCNVAKAKDGLFGPTFSETGGYGTTAGPYGVAVSPDGRHVYAADTGDNSIIVDAINSTTLTLSPVNVFESVSLPTGSRFTAPFQVAVSPDGRNVYVTGKDDSSLVTFARDADTGALTHVDSVHEGSGYGCTALQNCAGAVSGMQGAYGIALSPDGKFIYVSSITDDSIVVFGRDPNTGAASSTALLGSGAYFKQRYTNPGLNQAYGMAISPDGANLYATGYAGGGQNSALITLKRDPILGTLGTQQVLTTSIASGLTGAFRVTVSPDGLFVYAAAYNSDSICTFARNTLNGALTYRSCQSSAVYLNAASDIVIAQDGKRAFATGFSSNSLVAFDRNTATGALSQSDVITKNGTFPKIGGARGVALHPSGNAAYVTGFTDDRVVAIQFNRPTPLLGSLSPASVPAGGAALALTVKGGDFHPASVVKINGVGKPTQYLNSQTLLATIPAADLAAQADLNVSVVTPGPGGGDSNPGTLYVQAAGAIPVPAIESIGLPSIQAGAQTAVVDVLGSGFGPGALVIANGQARATTRISDKHLQGALVAADLANIGTLVISVDNQPALMQMQAQPLEATAEARAVEAPLDDGLPDLPVDAAVLPQKIQAPAVAPSASNGIGVDVVAPNLNPAPGLGGLSPDNAANQGGAAQLVVTITGSGFVLGAQASWNGAPRATDYVNANTLKMTISAGDLAFGGVADVSVANPAPGGGESNVLTFTINEAPPELFFFRVRMPLVQR